MPRPSVSQHDWSLHRKGFIDQHRHNEKIKDAIKQNLPNIVSREDIITSDGKTIVKVPIRHLDEYKFRFDLNKKDGVGQGAGKSKIGDVLGRSASNEPGQGEAGEQPGYDYYEAGVYLEELEAIIFEDMGLPNLQEKQLRQLESESVRFTDIRRNGIMSNLDKRRTILQNIKRNAMAGNPRLHGLKSEDLRFKTWEREIRHESNAVVIAMMDVSGSMGEFEKYIARIFYFWMVRFLRTIYQNVEIVFIAHHTEAKEVSEFEFFHKGESGGTKCSSAYQLALDIIEARYNPVNWNIYPFHFSDGDNFTKDNLLCVELINRMLEICNLFGYCQIKEGYHPGSTLLIRYKDDIKDPNFIGLVIEDKDDVLRVLKAFFSVRPKDAQAMAAVL